VLVTAGLMLAVYTILGVEEHGWTSARTLLLAAVSVALVAAFVLRQARIEKPLMPLRLFHSRNVTGANIVMALLVVGMFGIFFLGALYLQLVLGYEPLEVGLAFLPGSLLMGVLSLGFTDKLNMRFGARTVLIAGLGLLVVAMLLFARTPVDGNYLVDVFPTMIIFGAGAGVAFPALMMLAMSGATPSDAGLASGLVNTTGQVGGAIGLAVLATISTERTQSLLDDGESTASALLGGFHVAYLIGAALAAVAIAVAVTVLRAESPAAAMAGAHGHDGHGAPELADAPTGPAYDTV
jgi:predicted MFS family arabinose efflux permease